MTETGSTVAQWFDSFVGSEAERDMADRVLAVVEAAQEFSEACLDRTPSAYEGQPDTVWLQGSANPTGLHLLDALQRLHSQASDEGEA